MIFKNISSNVIGIHRNHVEGRYNTDSLNCARSGKFLPGTVIKVFDSLGNDLLKCPYVEQLDEVEEEKETTDKKETEQSKTVIARRNK